jgi:Fe(3+) dicitrate transport protein
MINIIIYNGRLLQTLHVAVHPGEYMKYTRLIHTLTAVIFSIPALAQETENSQSTWLEVVQIIGTRDEARNIAGSGALIDEDQIRIEAATDINQLLKTIPGTYVREEDGLGLRPNIGIRAAGSERSGKVTLLEDGVMIAPAPYSNPAAYYFPTTMRMSSVEVLKGAPLLRYGPQTTGGVINLISTPIPDSRSGNIMAVVGEHGTQDIHAY